MKKFSSRHLRLIINQDTYIWELKWKETISTASLEYLKDTQATHTVTLNCSVSTYEEYKYTVKWLYNNDNGVWISQSTCSASVTFTTSDHIYQSNNCWRFWSAKWHMVEKVDGGCFSHWLTWRVAQKSK